MDSTGSDHAQDVAVSSGSSSGGTEAIPVSAGESSSESSSLVTAELDIFRDIVYSDCWQSTLFVSLALAGMPELFDTRYP